MLTQRNTTQTLELRSVRIRKVDTKHYTHLAVYFSSSTKCDQVEDYGREGGDARDGINL
jgi:hypothetical protein